MESCRTGAAERTTSTSRVQPTPHDMDLTRCTRSNFLASGDERTSLYLLEDYTTTEQIAYLSFHLKSDAFVSPQAAVLSPVGLSPKRGGVIFESRQTQRSMYGDLTDRRFGGP